MTNYHSRILIGAITIFSFAILVGLGSLVTFTIKTKGTITKAANISHYVVPIIFYPADSSPPTQAQLDGLTNAYNAVRYWYALKTGQTFEYLPVRAYRGEQNKDYYLNSDNWICGARKTFCNIGNELANHERAALHAYGVADTSFGWWDRTTMIFTKDMPIIYNPPVSWSFALRNSERGGMAMLSSVVLDTLASDFGACNDYANAVGATDLFRLQLCTDKTQMGVIAHEMGHAIADLPDGGSGCDQYDLMCQGSYYFQNANFNAADLQKIQNSPFTNPPEIGSDEYNSWRTRPLNNLYPFCFESDNPLSWCASASPTGSVPVPAVENGLNPKIFAGGDCNAFGCDGPSLSTSWSNVTYRVELKCTYGAFCSNNYNQWTDCSTWPTGTCPPLDTTNNYVNILASAGFKYKYRVWIVTKKDGDVNNVAAYPWVSETSVNNTCASGTCSLKLSWPRATYDTNLTLSGVVQNGQVVDACSGNWTNPVNNTASPCESAWIGTTNTHTFTQLNIGIKTDLYVHIKDVNGASHLLQSIQNAGTTSTKCSSGYITCVATAPNVPNSVTNTLAGAAGSQSVTLNWSAPSSWGQECGARGTREYLVRVGESNPPPATYAETNKLNFSLSSLKTGKTYYYQVAAQNAAGMVSAYSAVGSFTTQSIVPVVPSTTFRPTGVGSSTQWTNSVPSGASHYQNVSEATADEDSSYISATADGLVDAYTHNPSGLASGTPIQSITVYARAKYVTGSTNNMVSPMIISGGVRKNQDITITNSYANYFATFTVDPATNLSWTVAAADAAQIGVRKSYAGADVRVTQVWAQVNYAGLDSDNDGFGDSVETYMGTDPNRACGVNAWPPDVNNDGVVNSIDQALVSKAFGTKVGDALYNRRYDLDASGSISILDLSLLAKYVGKACV